MHSGSRPRLAVLAVLPLALAGVLAGCVPDEPGPTPAPTTTADTPAATPTPSATPEPTPTATSGGGITLPETCERVWTAQGFGILTEEAGPLNDSGITMLSTEVVPALEVLDAAEHLRCTWGQPSEVGIATTVAIVDAEQSTILQDALRTEGFTCEQRALVQRCDRTETVGSGSGAQQVEVGETHLLGGNGWVASHWVGVSFEPQYSDDIAAQLWG